MTIVDGEYDIDVSALLNTLSVQEQDDSFAIRYGFIPDSMDQSKPLTLYQTDQEYILQAESTGSSGNNTIIFEGNRQRQETTRNPAKDAYVLSFPQDRREVVLKRLNNTIRVSKSRNVDKLELKLHQWDKENVDNQNRNIEVPKIETKKDIKSTQQRATKRTPKAPVKKPTHVTRDFDESLLSDDSNDEGFPEIELQHSIHKKQEPKKTVSSAPKKKISNEANPKLNKDTKGKHQPANESRTSTKPITTRSQRPNSKTLTNTVANSAAGRDLKANTLHNDIDDDFKDLEDQLREVLEDGESKPRNMNDEDDESDADDYSTGGPITIDFKDDASSNRPGVVTQDSYSGGAQKKPMSLRDLVRGGKGREDEDPSSEEE